MKQQHGTVIQEVDGVRMLEIFEFDEHGSSRRIGYKVEGPGADPGKLHSLQSAEDEYLRRLWI